MLQAATYELKPGQSLADAIQMAGGFTSAADRRRIQVERIVPPDQRVSSGTDRKMADFSAELLATAPALGGDIIRVVEVPNRVASRVTVNGSVWTPGVLGYASGMTLFDALRRAGGLKPRNSYLGDVQVTRLHADSTRSVLRSTVLDTVGHQSEQLSARRRRRDHSVLDD